VDFLALVFLRTPLATPSIAQNKGVRPALLALFTSAPASISILAISVLLFNIAKERGVNLLLSPWFISIPASIRRLTSSILFLLEAS